MNRPDKALFLDFDGVICGVNSPFGFELDMCWKIDDICKRTGAVVVVTSSRREDTLAGTIAYVMDLWQRSGGDLDRMPRWIPEMAGVTERGYRCLKEDQLLHHHLPRGVEIQWWIEEHMLEYDYENNRWKDFNYVILDDDTDMLLEHRDHFIHIDSRKGLTGDDVENAVKIMNNSSLMIK